LRQFRGKNGQFSSLPEKLAVKMAGQDHEVWRKASPVTIAADIATLIERCPATIGMMIRSSAFSCT